MTDDDRRDEINRYTDMEENSLDAARSCAELGLAKEATGWALIAMAAGQRARRIGDWMP